MTDEAVTKTVDPEVAAKDVNGDGHISKDEMALDMEFKRKRLEDEDAMRDRLVAHLVGLCGEGQLDLFDEEGELLHDLWIEVPECRWLMSDRPQLPERCIHAADASKTKWCGHLCGAAPAPERPRTRTHRAVVRYSVSVFLLLSPLAYARQEALPPG